MNLFHFSQNTTTHSNLLVLWSEPAKVTSLNRPTYSLHRQRAVITVVAHKCRFI